MPVLSNLYEKGSFVSMAPEHGSLLSHSREETLGGGVLFRSFAGSCFRMVVDVQILHQPHEALQLIPACVRDGAGVNIAGAPAQEVIAVTSCARGQCAARRGPAEQVDDMRSVLIDDGGGTLVVKVIGAAADQAIALRRKVCNWRRDIRMAGEPRLHRVPVGGGHIDEMVGHE